MTETNPRIEPVERATQRTWDEWLRFMDAHDARNLDHKQIAVKVYEEFDGTIESRGWWTEAMTVAYEQYIGRRVPGQRPQTGAATCSRIAQWSCCPDSATNTNPGACSLPAWVRA